MNWSSFWLWWDTCTILNVSRPDVRISSFSYLCLETQYCPLGDAEGGIGEYFQGLCLLRVCKDSVLEFFWKRKGKFLHWIFLRFLPRTGPHRTTSARISPFLPNWYRDKGIRSSLPPVWLWIGDRYGEVWHPQWHIASQQWKYRGC